MRSTEKRTAAILAVAFLCLMVLVCGYSTRSEADDHVTLKFTYWVNAGGLPETMAVLPFAKLVNERTNGEVTIETYPGATLAASDATLEAVLNGLADIGLVYTGWETGSFPITSMLEYPIYLASAKSASYVLRDLLNELQPPEIRNIHLLYNYCSGEGIYLSNVRPIASPADMKGQLVRVGSDVMNQAILAFGGTPVSMPSSESYEALRSGVANAWQGTPEAVNNIKLYEIVKYASPMHFGNTTYLAFMNKDKYESLSEKNRKIIDECAAELFETGVSDFMEKAADNTYKVLKENGVELTSMTEEQEQGFLKLIDNLIADYAKLLDGKGLKGTEALEKLRALADKYNELYPSRGN
jgi:TRAP-type C4-dicarboxylate transport system substrate-binding protein